MNASRSDSTILSWPRGKAGAASVALAALFLVVLGLNLWTSRGSEQNGFLVFATFLTALGVLASLILSAVAIVRQRKRSLLVWLPFIIGVLVLGFFAVEVFIGHD